MTTVIINDYVINRRTHIVLDASDFEVARRVMGHTEPDELLLELQDQDVFRGRTRISDLEPYHVKLLLEMNLKQAAAVKGDVLDLSDPIMKSLVFLIEVMIVFLEKRSQSFIETLRINRVGTLDAVVEWTAMLNNEPPQTKPTKKKNDISVVIDNT